MLQQVGVHGPIALVYSSRFLTDIENRLTPFVQEIDHLGRQGALPVTLEATVKGWRMAVHAARYVAWLYPTSAGDAYNLGHAARRQFRDEERLLKGALLLHCARGFRPFPDLRSYNDAVKLGMLPRTGIETERLWQAWHRLAPPADRPAAMPPEHRRYVDLLDMVVEASRQIEVDKQAAVPPQHYVSRAAAKEQRYSARGVYRFRMAGRSDLTTNTMVCLGDAPQMRGRVIRVNGREVTVRFEPGSDFDRIGGQGTLRLLPSDRIYRAQRAAIDHLRKETTRNPRLIENLVLARFLPYRPAVGAAPTRTLDPDQLEAFQRAIEAPDILCVLGPPGAGKTTTIVEVIKACVAKGRRVLITSHTHRAVDNVLKDLPSDLNVVRIGSEDKMTDKVKALSTESRVEAVRQEILADSSLFDALSEVRRQRPLLDRHLTHLLSTLDAARSAHVEIQQVEPAFAAAVRRVNAPLLLPLDQAERSRAQHRSGVVRLEQSLVTAERRLRAAATKAGSGSPLAFVYRWFATWQHGRIAKWNESLASARAALAQAESAFTALWIQAENTAAHDPQVVDLRGRREKAQRTLAGSWTELTRVGELIRQALVPMITAPPLPPSTVAGWTDFHQRCAAALATLEHRAVLLGQWRERISDLNVELEREIARYADVVAATCIGTDTSALISQLEFDLAIVDEAGQISTPNLLVPLVRADRAMLVGDHKQLPPFLDEEVRQWAAGRAASTDLTAEEVPLVRELLAKSGFELLFPRAPATNAIWLKTQRRMPIEIASFVSDTFYSSRLRTEHPGSDPNALFGSPFAMVDTSDRTPAERAETAMKRLGAVARHGYRNDLEAEIIADLVVGLGRQYRDWAVIVPFNAQKDLVIERLTSLTGASSQVADNVGTVDSFQGGERDLIIFGFTRSNPRGDVGFLRELRRFNVAVTRARRQLVLVGDLDTLRIAKDTGLRETVRSMSDHLARSGDRRFSRDVAAALRSMAEQRS